MLAQINHLNVGQLMPRKDSGPKPYHPKNFRGNIKYDAKNDCYEIELLDVGNVEFRVLLIINQDELDGAKQNVRTSSE